MTVVQTRATAATYTTLRTRVRAMLGDRETTAANQRWSDTDIDYAVNDQLAEMYSTVGEDGGSYMISTTMTYTADSETVSLPAAAQASPITRIEDITTPEFPLELVRVDIHAIESSVGALRPYVWSRADTTIAVRPKPADAKTLRIWYIGNPFVVTDGDGDQHPYPVAHEELICLGAAIRLQEEDQQVSPDRLLRYEKLTDKFIKQAHFFRGPRPLRSGRRYF